MKGLKGWPFEPFRDPEAEPCGGGPGSGPGIPN